MNPANILDISRLSEISVQNDSLNLTEDNPNIQEFLHKTTVRLISVTVK